MNPNSNPNLAELPSGWVHSETGLLVIERICVTQQSVVYKAEQQSLSRTVALKISLLPLEDDRRFRQEASVLENLNHDDIGKVFAYGIIHGHAYMLMEWLEGETLAHLIDRGQLDVNQLGTVFNHLCNALQYAHSQGIIHRDIKPSNIFVCMTGTEYSAKLIDFGLSKQIERDIELTRTGEIAGSPAYMSPEQCNSAPVDLRSDIYSLGCVLYQCTCGHPPFFGTSAYDVMYKHVNEMPKKLEGNEALWKTISRCLEKSPENRFSDVASLRSELVDALASRAPGLRIWSFVIPVLAVATIAIGIGLFKSSLHPSAEEFSKSQPAGDRISRLTKLDAKLLSTQEECKRLEKRDLSSKDRMRVLLKHAETMYHHQFCDENAQIGDELMDLVKKRDFPYELLRSAYAYAGIAYFKGNQCSKARAQLRKALEITESHESTTKVYDVTWTYMIISEVAEHQKDYTEMEAALRQVGEYAVGSTKTDNFARMAKVRLAECLQLQGRAREVLALIETATPDELREFNLQYAHLKRMAQALLDGEAHNNQHRAIKKVK